MIVVKVWGLPMLGGNKLKEIFKEVVESLSSVWDTGVQNERDVLILFPTDMMVYGLGMEVLVEIDGHSTNHLTVSQEELVTGGVGRVIKKHVPDANVAVVISTFNERNRAMWAS